MKAFMNKSKWQLINLGLRTKAILRDKRGENFVDSAISILIAVVLGALLLAGLYALFGDVVLPTLKERIEDMFDFAG